MQSSDEGNSRTKQSPNFTYSLTIYILPLLLLLLFLLSRNQSSTFEQSVRRALSFACLLSVVVGALFTPPGLISRPSPYLWKALTGLSIFYLVIITYFCFLSKDESLHLIDTYIAPRLQHINYKDISYGEDCRLYKAGEAEPWGNLQHALVDLFAVAHLLGWFLKTLICRDLHLLLLASATFQLVEFSLRNVLNNFKECWWDHILVDLLGCNLLGIVLGYWAVHYFRLERYKWSLREGRQTRYQCFKEFWNRWDLGQIQAKTYASLKKYIQVTYFIAILQINDLNIFFIKYIYKIPSSHPICLFRVILVGLLSCNATKEYFHFVAERERRIRINCFLVNFIIFTEIFVVLKHGKNQFLHANISPWGIFCLGILLLSYTILFTKIAISQVRKLLKIPNRELAKTQ